MASTTHPFPEFPVFTYACWPKRHFGHITADLFHCLYAQGKTIFDAFSSFQANIHAPTKYVLFAFA
jgi:hypothetical protein